MKYFAMVSVAAGRTVVEVEQHRGYVSRFDKPALNEANILAWADARIVLASGRWPTRTRPNRRNR